MKNLFAIFLVSLISFGLNAQKIIEKNLDYNGEYIEMDVKFASEIEVKTWDRSTIYFKADITTKEGKFLDAYELDIVQKSNRISIESEAEPIFRKFQDEWNKNNPKMKNRYYNTKNWYEFNYVLYVPKNAKFKVSSINGSLSSDVIEGDFTADLINGDIEIGRYAGNLDLQTINGEIDLKLKNTSVVAETIHGDIYADEKLKLKTTDRHVGQLVSGHFDGAKNTLKLNTINGNMYLRL